MQSVLTKINRWIVLGRDSPKVNQPWISDNRSPKHPWRPRVLGWGGTSLSCSSLFAGFTRCYYPRARFSKAPEAFRARKAISSVSKNREVYTSWNFLFDVATRETGLGISKGILTVINPRWPNSTGGSRIKLDRLTDWPQGHQGPSGRSPAELLQSVRGQSILHDNGES